MAKIIQICASRNDLFGLDEAGAVHRYNFNTKRWAVLRSAQHGNTGSLPDDDPEGGHDDGEPEMPGGGLDR